MRILILLIVLFAIYYGTSASAIKRFERASKPKYLDIEGFQQCLDSKQVGEAHNVWCYPAEKPSDCPKDSWDQLNALEESEAPNKCSNIS